jgi:predicted AlkP superfamily pyrophosphatase or phosphodiesterase
MVKDTREQDLVIPDYRGGSIVNLMASIMTCFGGRSIYPPLRSLAPKEMQQYENVILMIVDGLGQVFLDTYGRESVFAKYQRDTMTSVFPATTATAVTTFLTGLAPQQHAITGWFMYLKEMGVATAILPFVPRFGGAPFGTMGIDPGLIMGQPVLFNKLNAESYYVIHDDLVDSDYTRAFAGSAQPVGFQGLYDLMSRIQDIITSRRGKKYVYAYWSALDALCHRHGTSSAEAQQHFVDLAKAIPRFADSVKDTRTLILITADHGLVNTTLEQTIKVSEHKDFADTLTLPVCGEPRVPYCYVRPAKARQFESYVQTRFKNICIMHRAQDLIDRNYFGLFEPHPRLVERIGDYVLVMKGNYVMRDFVLGEKEFYFTGYHGGMTRSEMMVPLVVLGA